uniref:Uncharacterized protein n=1 Tax=Arundo donax TaxID=35708 RepID=A0A0A9DFL1_ARUDO
MPYPNIPSDDTRAFLKSSSICCFSPLDRRLPIELCGCACTKPPLPRVLSQIHGRIDRQRRKIEQQQANHAAAAVKSSSNRQNQAAAGKTVKGGGRSRGGRSREEKRVEGEASSPCGREGRRDPAVVRQGICAASPLFSASALLFFSASSLRSPHP